MISDHRSKMICIFSWLDYTPLNTWIENTRIVPFKCPLRRVKFI